MALSLAFGLRATLVRTPWQQGTIVVFAGYFGVATESFIIDTDHWRHTFLLLGVLWGVIAATWAYQKRPSADDHDRSLFDEARALHPRGPRRRGLPVGA